MRANNIWCVDIMADLQSMDEVLDEIFASYMRVKSQHVGRYDREFRNPHHLIALADALTYLPARDRTIRITGSKGKGTTSRLIAAYLHRALPSDKVGLLVSPEEFTHLDRMQINGVPITENVFISLYNELRPELAGILRTTGADGYLSPSGVFMLIALAWFAREDVDHYVLETGRGAKFDEVGQIESTVSVVTSIFLEHATNLGPTLDDIAADKLSVSKNSDLLVCPPGIANTYPSVIHCPVAQLLPEKVDTRLPLWLIKNDQLARTAASEYLARHGSKLSGSGIEPKSPSFLWTKLSGCRVLIEAIISASSADERLYAAQFKGRNTHVLASLPDDKDRDQLLDLWNRQGLHCREIALSGTRGYLNYAKAKNTPAFLCELAFNAPERMHETVKQYIRTHQPDVLYLAGTQTYVRLVKQALKDVL